MTEFETLVEEVAKHLSSNRQNWLLGAGISCDANIPLMNLLTKRVKAIINSDGNDKNKEIYNSLETDLEPDAHIEHYLSHLGDLIALAERSNGKTASLNGKNNSQQELKDLHSAIVKAIGETVRYGFKSDASGEEIGKIDKPIIDIQHHINFIKEIFKSRENLISRSKISFFTTNYDTLLEDAMALERIMVVDGFSGGAMGFWNPEKEFNSEVKSPYQINLFKLHGSVDWHRNPDTGLIRARYGTKYLSDLSEIMIYPQATKYVETQKDPFASLFGWFRTILNSNESSIIITCGYSFGDEHINSEIESALTSSTSLTLIAFTNEVPNGGIKINKTLDKWLESPRFGKRIFVAGENGLYNNSLIPVIVDSTKKLSWWKFSGLTEFLKTGEPE